MKNLLLYPIKQSCDIDEKISDKIKSTGENTGNLIFVNAVQQQLSNFIIGRNIYSPHEYRGEMEDEITSAVIPASNWLNATDEVIALVAGFVDKQKFPVTLAGLGAQSTQELNTPRKLVNHLGTHKIYAMKSLSDNCKSIGIRGEFTAECLELMNINNYKIIGCPSAYIYPDGEWKKDLKATEDKILFNVTTGNVYETHILTLGWQRNAKWIMQSMNELPKTVFEQASIEERHIERSFPQFAYGSYKLQQYMKNNAKIFFNAEKWERYISEQYFTFCFGSRFHGNMAALRSGVPALWITHDSRTTELVQALHLPHIDYHTFSKIKKVEELLEFCHYSNFISNYPILYKNYKSYLDENNLQTNI